MSTRKRGRPTNKVKREVISMRVRRPILAQLKAASEKSNRSISSEIEARLDQSVSDRLDPQIRKEITAAVKTGMKNIDRFVQRKLNHSRLSFRNHQDKLCLIINSGDVSVELPLEVFIKEGVAKASTLTDVRTINDNLTVAADLSTQIGHLQEALGKQLLKQLGLLSEETGGSEEPPALVA